MKFVVAKGRMAFDMYSYIPEDEIARYQKNELARELTRHLTNDPSFKIDTYRDPLSQDLCYRADLAVFTREELQAYTKEVANKARAGVMQEVAWI